MTFQNSQNSQNSQNNNINYYNNNSNIENYGHNKSKKLKNFIFNFILFIVSICVTTFFVIQVSNYVCPIKYSDAINKYSEEYNLEKNLIYSVINAESRFNLNALSSKGAIGLMQIMPSTGEWLIEKINSELNEQDKINANNLEQVLYTPELNIRLGCYYLSYLIDRFQSEENALCAYNAGSTNVTEWLQNPAYSDNDILIDIPFGETKRYVKKIEYFKIGYQVKLKLLDLSDLIKSKI